MKTFLVIVQRKMMMNIVKVRLQVKCILLVSFCDVLNTLESGQVTEDGSGSGTEPPIKEFEHVQALTAN